MIQALDEPLCKQIKREVTNVTPNFTRHYEITN